MDIEQIEILKAVRDTGSINAASQKLFMAKSAISASIKRLELELGFEFLDRSSYRVKLSSRARMYLAKAETLLDLRNELNFLAKQLSHNIESQLRISSSLLYPLPSFINLIKKISKKFPSTTINLDREILSGEQMLIDEEVDLAIIETNSNSPDLEYKKFLEVKMPLVINREHDFFKLAKKEQNLENLQHYPQIVLRSTNSHVHHVRGGVYQDATKCFVSDDYTKKELILQGLGWGRLPEHLIKKEIDNKSLFILEHIEKTLVIDLFIARRKNHSYGEVSENIWNENISKY